MSRLMTKLMAASGLAVTGAAIIPAASADQASCNTAGCTTANVPVNFSIVIPAVLRLRIGAVGTTPQVNWTAAAITAANVGDGNAVESVFIPEEDRGTLCVSSQAGCAVGCRFCSKGHQGFSRNLTTGEIIAQLWIAEHFLRKHLERQDRVITNVVMMGMGEPDWRISTASCER